MGEIFTLQTSRWMDYCNKMYFYGEANMSTTTHMVTNFCTGCVAAATAVIAIATIATIIWVLFL